MATSLSYNGEHAFWKAFITKEIKSSLTWADDQLRPRSRSSGRFGRSVSQSRSSGRIISKRSISKEKSFPNEGYNQAYAFGGKTHISQASSNPKNPVLSRPASSGSYKPARKFNIKSQYHIANKEMLNTSSISASTRKSLRKELSLASKKQEQVNTRLDESTKTVEEKPNPIMIPQVTTQLKLNEVESVLDDIISVKQGEKPEQTTDPQSETQEKDADTQEKEDEKQEEEEEFPKRPETASTWKTSGSQKNYIEKLEQMLRSERKKRVALESQLNEKE